jgi:hypothetical protein
LRHREQHRDCRGDETDFTGREICVLANEDTGTILDAAHTANVTMLARAPYDTSPLHPLGRVHRGPDVFLLGEEIGQLARPVESTTTYMWGLRDLDDPVLRGADSNSTGAIDHNIFIKDGLA